MPDISFWQQRIGLLRPPAAPRVGVHGRGVVQDGVDHTPRRLDGLLAGEQPTIAVEGRLSAEPCWLNDMSSTCGVHPAPGVLPTSVIPTSLSGQIRKRSRLVASECRRSNMSCGGRRNRNETSVAVTGMHLPARMRIPGF